MSENSGLSDIQKAALQSSQSNSSGYYEISGGSSGEYTDIQQSALSGDYYNPGGMYHTAEQEKMAMGDRESILSDWRLFREQDPNYDKGPIGQDLPSLALGWNNDGTAYYGEGLDRIWRKTLQPLSDAFDYRETKERTIRREEAWKNTKEGGLLQGIATLTTDKETVVEEAGRTEEAEAEDIKPGINLNPLNILNGVIGSALSFLDATEEVVGDATERYIGTPLMAHYLYGKHIGKIGDETVIHGLFMSNYSFRDYNELVKSGNPLAGEIQDEAHEAARMFWTNLYDHAKVDEFLQRYREGEDGFQLSKELEHPWAELVGDTLVNPMTWVDLLIPGPGSTELKTAQEFFETVVEGGEDMLGGIKKGLQSGQITQDMLQEKAPEFAQLIMKANDDVDKFMVDVLQSATINGGTTKAKRVVVMDHAMASFARMLRATDDPQEAMALVNAAMNFATGDTDKILDSLQNMSKLQELQAGLTNGTILFGKMMHEFTGGDTGMILSVINKAKKEGLSNADTMMKVMDKLRPNLEKVAKKFAPTTNDLIKAGKKVDPYVRAINAVENALPGKLFAGARDYMSLFYLGLSPAYAVRNMVSDTVLSIIDHGFGDTLGSLGDVYKYFRKNDDVVDKMLREMDHVPYSIEEAGGFFTDQSHKWIKKEGFLGKLMGLQASRERIMSQGIMLKQYRKEMKQTLNTYVLSDHGMKSINLLPEGVRDSFVKTLVETNGDIDASFKVIKDASTRGFHQTWREPSQYLDPKVASLFEDYRLVLDGFDLNGALREVLQRFDGDTLEDLSLDEFLMRMSLLEKDVDDALMKASGTMDNLGGVIAELVDDNPELAGQIKIELETGHPFGKVATDVTKTSSDQTVIRTIQEQFQTPYFQNALAESGELDNYNKLDEFQRKISHAANGKNFDDSMKKNANRVSAASIGGNEEEMQKVIMKTLGIDDYTPEAIYAGFDNYKAKYDQIIGQTFDFEMRDIDGMSVYEINSMVSDTLFQYYNTRYAAEYNKVIDDIFNVWSNTVGNAYNASMGEYTAKNILDVTNYYKNSVNLRATYVPNTGKFVNIGTQASAINYNNFQGLLNKAVMSAELNEAQFMKNLSEYGFENVDELSDAENVVNFVNAVTGSNYSKVGDIKVGHLEDSVNSLLVKVKESRRVQLGMTDESMDFFRRQGLDVSDLEGRPVVMHHAEPTVAMSVEYNTPIVKKELEKFRDKVVANWGYQEEFIPDDDFNRALMAAEQIIRSDVAEMKNMSVNFARNARDFTFLNYGDKTNMDTAFSYLFPYQFWYRKSYQNWPKRIVQNPAVVTAYMNYRQATEKLNVHRPEWWRHSVQTDFGGIIKEPLVFNVEATLNPIYGAVGVDFEDPARVKGWWTKFLQDGGKWGASWHPLITLATAGGLYLQGEKEAAARWGGRLLPQTQAIKGASFLLTGNAIEIDPATRLFSGKYTPFELRRIGREASAIVAENPEYEPYMFEQLQNQEGKLWDQAVSMAMGKRAWGNVWSYLTGVGFKARTQTDVDIDTADQAFFTLYSRKPYMDNDQFKEAMNALHNQYPWYSLVSTTRKSGPDKDSAISWHVMGKIPPGNTDDLARDFGLPYNMLEKFYETKGDLSEWAEDDRQSFMNFIMTAGMMLEFPDDMTRKEWQYVKAETKKMYENLEKEFGEGIQDLDSMYYEAINEGGMAAGQAFLQRYPNLQAYRDKKVALQANDPIVGKYYGGLDLYDKYYNSEIKQELKKMFPGIDDILTEYYRLEGKSASNFWRANPVIKRYYDERDRLQGIAEANLFDLMNNLDMEEGTPVNIVRDPQTMMQQQFVDRVEDSRTEFPVFDRKMLQEKLGRGVYNQVLDLIYEGRPMDPAMMRTLSEVAESLGMSREQLMQLVARSQQ